MKKIQPKRERKGIPLVDDKMNKCENCSLCFRQMTNSGVLEISPKLPL